MKKIPTKQAHALAEALQRRGIVLELEHYDGHKHVDIFIPKARIYIEVDGPQHDLKTRQVISDFDRDYFSYKEGFFTKHITNAEIETHLEQIANIIAKVVEEASDKMGEHLHKKLI
jgi:very-short-patch-repair endonuclease